MNESSYTRRLLAALRARLPQAVIVKLSDNYTAGLPDLFVSINGVVTWYECKLLPQSCVKIEAKNVALTSFDAVPYAILRPRMIPALQWHTLFLLRRGYLVVYTENGWGITHVTERRAAVRSVRMQLLRVEELADKIVEFARIN